MQTRRLITAPLVVLASVLFVGAVIETGQQARERSVPARADITQDAGIRAEIDRVATAMQAETRCIGAFECGADQRAARVRSEVAAVGRWPADQRFAQERDALMTQLELRAAIIVQRAAMKLDGELSIRERERLSNMRSSYRRAARDAIDARHAVGLLNDTEYAGALDAWLAAR